MSAINVTPVTAPTWQAWQIVRPGGTPTEGIVGEVGDAEAAFEVIAPLGWTGDLSEFQQPGTTGIVMTATLTGNNHPNLIGYESDWIVFDGTNVSIVASADMWTTYQEAVSS